MFVRKAAVSLLRRVRLPSQSIYVSASASRPVKATATPLPFPLSTIILGINVNHVLAEDVSTSSESDEQGANIVGLRKIEDGSVISNIHTSKWRGKLEEAEKFFLSALKEAKEGFGERDSHVASACNNLKYEEKEVC
ncbi:hypothetical protein QQP08_014545 [Theobroma cacao]|nr:hypothetical protein QQP08_012785 [Theobroma cacao]WRX22058.1 hypothetical protein QQP08_014545 [Theobroma cacao]